MSRRPRRGTWGLFLLVLAASTIAACTISSAGGIMGMVLSLLAAASLLAATGAATQGCDSADEVYPVVGPCLTIAPNDDWGVAACLSDAGSLDPFDAQDSDWVEEFDIGPCLSDPGRYEPLDTPDTQEANEVDIGPCLSPPLNDRGHEDSEELSDEGNDDGPGLIETDFGPCLSVLPPDFGSPEDPDEGEGSDDGDAGDEGDGGQDREDSGFGPCLSPPIDAQNSLRPPGVEDRAPAAKIASSSRDALLRRFAEQGALPEDVLRRLQGSDDEEG